MPGAGANPFGRRRNRLRDLGRPEPEPHKKVAAPVPAPDTKLFHFVLCLSKLNCFYAHNKMKACTRGSWTLSAFSLAAQGARLPVSIQSSIAVPDRSCWPARYHLYPMNIRFEIRSRVHTQMWTNRGMANEDIIKMLTSINWRLSLKVYSKC